MSGFGGEGEIRTLDGPVTHNGFRARPSGRPLVLNSETAVGPFSITVCAVSATVSFARERIKRVSDNTCTWLWKSSMGFLDGLVIHLGWAPLAEWPHPRMMQFEHCRGFASRRLQLRPVAVAD